MGVTRALIYPDPIEFVVLPDRIYQHFMWGYGIRTIWTDARKLPEGPDQPRWWGYSVGHWEGDTFVVESTGRNERTWVDHFRYPHSDSMHLDERYRRTNYNTLEPNWTITDPKVLTRPWVGQTKRFHILAKDEIKTVDASAASWKTSVLLPTRWTNLIGAFAINWGSPVALKDCPTAVTSPREHVAV